MSIRRRFAALTALVALVLTVVFAVAPNERISVALAQPRQRAGSDAQSVTSEKARVDAVVTPALHWSACRRTYFCSTVRLPLDYDNPSGATVKVALLKAPATDQANRIGSLFLNPGGPDGSGRDLVRRAGGILSADLRCRFDLIGMDPRGTNARTRVQCYSDAAAQASDTAVLDAGFPITDTAERRYRRASKGLARACTITGRPFSASMSTAEVARDVDVLRRAVGDRQLFYLGWSYGAYLGEIYANLFPGRRALAIDGVIDPLAWQGTPETADDLPDEPGPRVVPRAHRAPSTLPSCRLTGLLPASGTVCTGGTQPYGG